MIRMSPKPIPIGTRFWGDALEGNIIHGAPYEVVWPATRTEFLAGHAELTAETIAYLAAHPVLYFYRTQPLRDLVGLIYRAAYGDAP